uniref:Uncharacterized protein n=1 Tax=Accipiter nisus TaxID=211598 RepID=A0A8B9NMZ7_9AVES
VEGKAGCRRRPSRPPLNLPPPAEDVPPGSAAPQLAAMGPGPRNLSKRFPSSFRPAFPEPVAGLGKAVVPLSGSGRRPRSVPCREIAGGGCHSAWRDDRSPCRGSVRPVGSLKSSPCCWEKPSWLLHPAAVLALRSRAGTRSGLKLASARLVHDLMTFRLTSVPTPTKQLRWKAGFGHLYTHRGDRVSLQLEACLRCWEQNKLSYKTPG